MDKAWPLIGPGPPQWTALVYFSHTYGFAGGGGFVPLVSVFFVVVVVVPLGVVSVLFSVVVVVEPSGVVTFVSVFVLVASPPPQPTAATPKMQATHRWNRDFIRNLLKNEMMDGE